MFWLLLLFAFNTSAKEIALTFDDAPRGAKYLSGNERTKKLIQTLRSAGIERTVFFCNSKRMDAAGAKRVRAYADAGHLIANHSHSHPALSETSIKKYIEDIEKAEQVFSKFPNWVRWFRFPFLDEGKTVEKRDALRAWLDKNNYFQGYVTVDDYDWYIDKLFVDAAKKNPNIDLNKVRDFYVQRTVENAEFYHSVAETELGRSPKHVLLLHENDVAALFIGDLVAELRHRGWRMIDPKEAYTDPIAQQLPKTLSLGQGRVMALAIDRGYQGPTAVNESEALLDKLFQEQVLDKKL